MQIDDLKKKLEPIFKGHKVKKAILFGSFARNEGSHHSDVDLILVQNTNLRFLDRYDGILAAISQPFLRGMLTCSSTRLKNWLEFPVGALSGRP